ncbi:hypothetical protein HNR16_003227 [Pseudoclavibacter chungangensis]|uniref:hypothetical protein n=1 Tax=Pseudoclavibacter chungangensis TaxID=587635 RepID=UPI0015C7105B|nr:hypothetical protein [Pseudoclavibacter chungangensis]NYJ68439.1 hypothetical protein [Pseudoclavibacter chungangensis]
MAEVMQGRVERAPEYTVTPLRQIERDRLAERLRYLADYGERSGDERARRIA